MGSVIYMHVLQVTNNVRLLPQPHEIALVSLGESRHTRVETARTARELPDRTAAHGASPATTRRLRRRAAAATGRLLTPSSDRYLPPYSWERRFWHHGAFWRASDASILARFPGIIGESQAPLPSIV